jgi:hypothetical protein
MHDRKQPPPGAFSSLPIVKPHKRPFETVLNEIVGGIAIAQQRARITAQAWYLAQDCCLLVVHDRWF